MMERRVLDALEARRMVLVGSYVRNMSAIPSFRLEYEQTEEKKKEKRKKKEEKTYHPPSTTSTPLPIPTNHGSHRKNSIQHHNPHRSPHQSLQTSHIEMRIPNREEIYVGSL